MDFKPHFNTLTRCLVERGDFSKTPFYLIDVGCGGGLPKIWDGFQNALAGVGIDPQVSECHRLQEQETRPNFRYVPRFLRLPRDHWFRQQRGEREPWTGNPWERTSAAQAMHILAEKTRQEDQFKVLNAWSGQALVEPTTTSTLDELVEDQLLPDVDFIKIDVDGPDFEVLLSAEKTIRDKPVLGLALEVNFSGTADPTDNTFHNIDRCLRSWGFDLFELSTRRCTMAALPATFRFDEAPHETDYGRVLQGDALYLRDPVGWEKVPENSVALSPTKLLKLCCLFELFSMPDHAAELIRDRNTELEQVVETLPLLHLLAHQSAPHLRNYHEHVNGFRDDPASFYPSRRPQS
ncbi:MAG: hypothetical protein SynsKO_01600 [Synoicihabitans sp.]